MADFSITAIKKLRHMTKDQLVKLIIDMSNYAEAQKADNIILKGAIEQLRHKLGEKMEQEAQNEAITTA